MCKEEFKAAIPFCDDGKPVSSQLFEFLGRFDEVPVGNSKFGSFQCGIPFGCFQ